MSEEARTPGSAGSDARTAGRGGVAVLGAKLFFLVVGFVQQPLLRRVVGLNDFGALAQAMIVSNVVNNVVVTSGTQGVSRAVAGAKGHDREVLRAALRVHVPLAFVVAGAMALGAPIYARFEHADDVVVPLLVLAGVALLYGFYAPLIGFLNGTNRFGRQALLDVIFATLRTAGLIGVSYAFVKHGLSGVLGTTVGWLGAALLIVPLAIASTGLGRGIPSGTARPSAVPHAGRYLGVLASIAGAQLCTNALMQIDIFLLGRFLSDGAASAGIAGDMQREAVTRWVAIYRECQTFAFLPYQLLFSVTLILFPMLARAKAANDTEAMRGHVARGARLAAIFGGLLVGVVVAIPESMLSFAYGQVDAAQGADVLRTMALAQGAFAMLGIATTVLTSIGRERGGRAGDAGGGGRGGRRLRGARSPGVLRPRPARTVGASVRGCAPGDAGRRRGARAGADGCLRARGDGCACRPGARGVRRTRLRDSALRAVRDATGRRGGRRGVPRTPRGHGRDRQAGPPAAAKPVLLHEPMQVHPVHPGRARRLAHVPAARLEQRA
jgi:stage V sporulation protein B